MPVWGHETMSPLGSIDVEAITTPIIRGNVALMTEVNKEEDKTSAVLLLLLLLLLLLGPAMGIAVVL
jgi:hypothetical protein